MMKFQYNLYQMSSFNDHTSTTVKTAVMKMISSYNAAGGASQWHMYLHYKIK